VVVNHQHRGLKRQVGYRQHIPAVSKIVTDYIESKYSIHLTRTADKPSVLDEALKNAIDGGRIIVERRIIHMRWD
jgi:hypothetical protein